MAHDHHDHDDGHGSPLTETQLRVRALESLLIEKGLVDPIDPRAGDDLGAVARPDLGLVGVDQLVERSRACPATPAAASA